QVTGNTAFAHISSTSRQQTTNINSHSRNNSTQRQLLTNSQSEKSQKRLCEVRRRSNTINAVRSGRRTADVAPKTFTHQKLS
ncbi:unnamed protein product, partial [Larinioides sclopetarius]